MGHLVGFVGLFCLAFFVNAVLSTSLAAQTYPVDHPVMDFGDDRERLERRVRRIEDATDEELLERLEGRNMSRGAGRTTYFSAIQAAIGLWETTEEAAYRDLAARACRIPLGELLDASEDDLRARITEVGPQDDENVRMRDACLLLALLYHVTKEREHAERATVLLARFAEQVPKWPIYKPHMGPWEERDKYAQSSIKSRTAWDMAGIWGEWIYVDIHHSLPFADAYDLVYGAGTMQETGSLEAIEALLVSQVDLQFGYGPVFSNMDPTQMRGILWIAKVLGRPDWVHACARWIENIYRTQFYADGWWHEGTPSYHKQTQQGLEGVIRRHLDGYTDPPGYVDAIDGSRFDDLDLLEDLARPIGRANAALNAVQQPNRICQVIHDTTFPQKVWWAPPMEEAVSHLSGCTGHAILGCGQGEDNMVQASLHFGGTHGHEHLDCLNLILFAKGKELISETRYRPGNVTNTTREWHTMTAGHVTVVVDGEDQPSRGSHHTPKRKRQPEDDVPGVPDPRWRWGGHGNVMNDGRLRIFNTDFDRVQVVEADGERSYGSLVKLDQYRRTIALVRISDTDVYVVDIFRVKGGKVHDYMLHSCLEEAHAVELSEAVDAPEKGSLHKYIQDVKGADVDGPWTATFSLDEGDVGLKTFVLSQEGTQILRGDAPAMRREGTAPFIAVRQSDGESVFAAVHHPFSGASVVQGVEMVPLEGADEGAVAIRVTLPDRVDTIISTADDDDRQLRRTLDGRVAMQGRFAHIAEVGGELRWAYLSDGDLLRVGEVEIAGETAHTGVIRSTSRIEAGDTVDAFVTDATLPADGSLDGHKLMVDQGGLLVQSFGIQAIERRDETTWILSHDEPGMTVTPGLVKLEYFPSWGIDGEARFKIAGSALLEREPTGEWSFSGTGDVKAEAGGKEIQKTVKH